MGKIETLTKEQEAQLAIYRDKWLAIGLSTEKADRKKAEMGIQTAYSSAGLPTVKKIVWCGSPLSSGLTRAIVLNFKKLPASVAGASVRDSVGASAWDSVRDSVGDSVWDSVAWDSVRDSVGDSVWDSVVGASVWDSVRASVWDSVVGASVWDSVGDSVRDSVWDSVVGASVWDSVAWDSVRASVWDSVVGASVGDSVRDSVWDSVWDSVVGASVWDSVRDSVRDSVWDSVVRDSVRASVRASAYGQHDANWLGFYDYFRNVLHLESQTKKLLGLTMIAQNANWFIPHQNICWISERHDVCKLNAQGRIHCDGGPAIHYPDGFSVWGLNGVRVQQNIAEEKAERLDPLLITKEKNAEVRREIVRKIGIERVCAKLNAKCVDKQGEYELLMLELGDGRNRPYLKMLNPSIGVYHIEGVHPDCATVEAALNWRNQTEEAPASLT